MVALLGQVAGSGQTQTLAGDESGVLESKATAAVVACCKQPLDRLKVLAGIHGHSAHAGRR